MKLHLPKLLFSALINYFTIINSIVSTTVVCSFSLLSTVAFTLIQNQADAADLTLSDSTVTWANGAALRASETFHGNVTFDATTTATLTYAGGTLIWDTITSSFNGGTENFETNKNVTFQTAAADVTLGDNITAGDVIIQTEVTLSSSATGGVPDYTLTSPNIQLNTEGTLQLNTAGILDSSSEVKFNGGTLAFGETMSLASSMLNIVVSNALQFDVLSGKTATITGALTPVASMVVGGTGTLVLEDPLAATTTTIEQDTILTIRKGSNDNTTRNIGGAGTMIFAGAQGNTLLNLDAFTGTLQLEEGSAGLRLDANYDATTQNRFALASASMSGTNVTIYSTGGVADVANGLYLSKLNGKINFSSNTKEGSYARNYIDLELDENNTWTGTWNIGSTVAGGMRIGSVLGEHYTLTMSQGSFSNSTDGNQALQIRNATVRFIGDGRWQPPVMFLEGGSELTFAGNAITINNSNSSLQAADGKGFFTIDTGATASTITIGEAQNNYTGLVNVRSGTLLLQVADSFANAKEMIVYRGTLDMGSVAQANDVTMHGGSISNASLWTGNLVVSDSDFDSTNAASIATVDHAEGAVTIKAGAELNISTAASIDSLSNNGKMTIGANLTIEAAVAAKGGELSVEGDLTLTGADTSVENTFTTLTVTGNLNNSSDLTMDAGSSIHGALQGGALTILESTPSADTTIGSVTEELDSLDHQGASTLTITTGDLSIAGSLNNLGTLSTAGDITLKQATSTGGSIATTGTLNLTGGNTFTSLAVDSAVVVQGAAGELVVNAASTADSVTNVSKLTINNGLFDIDTTADQSFAQLDGAGSLTVGGNLSLTGTTESSLGGDLSIGGSTLTLGSALSVTGKVSGPASSTLTIRKTADSIFDPAAPLIAAGSIEGYTTLDVIISPADILAMGLANGTWTVLDVSTAMSSLTDVMLNTADTSIIAGAYEYTLQIHSTTKDVLLVPKFVGNRWNALASGDMTWGNNANWSGSSAPSNVDLSAIFSGGGTSSVIIASDASTFEVLVDVEVGSATDTYNMQGSGVLTTGKLTVRNGTLTVGNTINIVDSISATTNPKGVLALEGTSALEITSGGDITALSGSMDTTSSLTIGDGASLSILGNFDGTGAAVANAGTLSLGDGSVIDLLHEEAGTIATADHATVSIGRIHNQNFALGDGSTLSTDNDVDIMSMTGTGLLHVGDGSAAQYATLKGTSITSGRIKVDTLQVATGAIASLSGLQVNKIDHQSALSTTAASLSSESIDTYTGGGKIMVSFNNDSFFATDNVYYFYDQAGGASWSSFDFTDTVKATINAQVLAGKDVLLTQDGTSLTITVQASTDRQWIMSNNYAVTPQQDNQLSHAGPIYNDVTGVMMGYDALDMVRSVYFNDADQAIDLRGLGSGTLTVSNLSGDAGITLNIYGDDMASSIVNLTNTQSTYAQNDISASGVTLKVSTLGADTLLETGHINLINATLDASPTTQAATGANITVAGLSNADSTGAATNAALKGTISVNGAGGVYTGAYEAGVTINALSGADQKLRADAALTVGGKGGTLYITDATSAAQLGGIQSTGASIIIDLTEASSATNSLTLGSASSITNGGSLTLSVNGDYLEEGDTVVALSGQALTVDSSSTLVINVINLDQSPDVSSSKLIKLIEFADGSSIAEESITLDAALQKYYINVRFDSMLNALVADLKPRFTTDASLTSNGEAGFDMIVEISLNIDPQSNNSLYPDLAKVMDELDQLVGSDPAAADRLAAAIAGASVASQGMAVSDDMERQLRSIRNRAGSSLGPIDAYIQEDRDIQAWINAEGNHTELSGESTNAGYTMSSWGGTVGADFLLNKQTALGIALTVMLGDFSSTDVDHLNSDLNTHYVSFFGITVVNGWEHKLVVAAGIVDLDGTRRVNFGADSYNAQYSTSGYSLGMHYEMARNFYLNEEKSMFWQPLASLAVQSSHVGGYTETDTDAALTVGDQDMTYATLGLGARMQMNVGERIYNRAASLSLRGELKADLGDSRSVTQVALTAGGHRAEVESSERGQFGIVFGAGLQIPISVGQSSVFCDAAVELRENYNNVNATVGYRFSF